MVRMTPDRLRQLRRVGVYAAFGLIVFVVALYASFPYDRAKEAATRKSLVGSGDRSDRIRTYNFAQGRVTDHRIGLTLYKLQAILDGDLGEIVAALQAAQAA